ncbi:hypothetical protein TNCV_2826071 [Trichonephila clavipes]|nr:hypothetical protein TNCV_2826071 [Trichonephila clavipes]
MCRDDGQETNLKVCRKIVEIYLCEQSEFSFPSMPQCDGISISKVSKERIFRIGSMCLSFGSREVALLKAQSVEQEDFVRSSGWKRKL